jgi:deoxycytidylate deaminase
MCDILNILINTALKSTMNHKHGCIIMYRNKIISTGYNYFKGRLSNNYSDDYIPNKYSIHAEKDAILKIKDKSVLKNCKIYVIRLKNPRSKSIITENGVMCDMCNHLIKKYGLIFKQIKIDL